MTSSSLLNAHKVHGFTGNSSNLFDSGVDLGTRLDASFAQAMKCVKRSRLQKDIHILQNSLARLDAGIGKESERGLIELKLASALRELSTLGTFKYTESLKRLFDFAAACSAYSVSLMDLKMRECFIRKASTDLESMLCSVENSHRGARGQADLRALSQQATLAQLEKRFSEVAEHLKSRIDEIDANQTRKLSRFARSNVILTAILEISKAGELTRDAAIFFFDKNGILLEDRNRDCTSRSLWTIDAHRLLDHGLNADGAGLYRFMSKGDLIAGAAIVRPQYDANGQVVTLADSRPNKRPIVAKQVVRTVGQVPELIQPGLAFRRMIKLCRFNPENNGTTHITGAQSEDMDVEKMCHHRSQIEEVS